MFWKRQLRFHTLFTSVKQAWATCCQDVMSNVVQRTRLSAMFATLTNVKNRQMRKHRQMQQNYTFFWQMWKNLQMWQKRCWQMLSKNIVDKWETVFRFVDDCHNVYCAFVNALLSHLILHLFVNVAYVQCLQGNLSNVHILINLMTEPWLYEFRLQN